MTSRFDKSLIPRHLQAALDRYVIEHIPTGSFLEAVLTNDLKGAIQNASDDSLDALPAIVAYVHNNTPHDCKGSREAYERWIQS